MNAKEATSFSAYRKRFVSISAGHIIERLNFKESDSLLDVCCGSGELTKLVTENAGIKSTTAMDINPNMINVAMSTNNADNITYIVGDAETAASFKAEWKNSFDKVLAYYALNWVSKWPDTARHLYECLKPGGEGYLNIVVDRKPHFFSVIHDAINELPKWQTFVQGFQYKHYPLQGNEEDFANSQESCFVDVKVEVDNALPYFVFENDLQTKAFIKSFLTQLECIPDKLKEEFLEDVFRQAEPKCEKTEDGRAMWKDPVFFATVRKE
ncbi:uncharacterized protein LOC144347597 [Saccoglossus kowalevskii]